MSAAGGLATALRRIEGFTLSAGILALAAVTIANVLFRTFGARSLAWAEELSGFLVLWVTFLGIAEAARKNRHIRMTALTDMLSEETQRRLECVVAIVTAAFLVGLAAFATDYVLRVRSWGAVSPALRLPLFLVYTAAPVGFLAAAGEYALIAIRGGVADEETPPEAGSLP